jgi:MFS transporter, CP family, cyanate transporter
MMSSPAHAGPADGQRLRPTAVLAVLLVAFNLRAALTSVGPVLEDIRADLDLSAAAASTLATLPLVCFGVASLIVPRLARRLGLERTLAIALALTAAGLALRVSPSVVALFGGTLAAGAAIAVGNVLVPVLIKRDFPQRTGLMMGLYVGVMVGAASAAAAVTVPIAEITGWGWRGGLGVWALPALLALLVWVAMVRGEGGSTARPPAPPSSLLRDGLAWQVTAFMGLQSLGFYALVAWLPAIYRSNGLSPQRAGLLLSLLVLVGVPIALAVPSLVSRTADQRGWPVATTAATAVGLVGLLLAPASVPTLWAVLLGIGTGASFPLALTLVVARSSTTADAARLSAMSQSVGYLVAAAGPFAFGALHDLTGGWRLPLALLVLLLVPQGITGWGAGRDVHVAGHRMARRPR